MRIAVLADIHGNLSALQAVLEDIAGRTPDFVFVAGDIVNRGPRPAECLQEILERQRTQGWRVIRGNHEDYVLAESRSTASRPAWMEEICRHTAWTCARLAGLMEPIAALPDRIDFEAPSGHHIRCVHASMGGNRVGLYEGMADDELCELMLPLPDVLCVGHTHMPFIRRINERLVMNVGAVGMPFDGDVRASYGLLELRDRHWVAQVVRLDYDRAAAARAFEASGYLDAGGPMAALIFREFERARPMLSKWHREYEPAVSSGRMTVADSVLELLART